MKYSHPHNVPVPMFRVPQYAPRIIHASSAVRVNIPRFPFKLIHGVADEECFVAIGSTPFYKSKALVE